MSVFMCKFNDVNEKKYYINVGRIEYASFMEVPNASHVKRAYIRCGEGLIDTQVSNTTADRIQAYLDSFV